MSNGTITMTGAEYDALAGKIAALEAELAKLRAVPDGDIFWREKLAIKFCEARGILDGSKEREGIVDAFVSALSLAPSAPATVVSSETVQGVNQQLLEALEELMYARTDKAEALATAAIAAARKGEV